MKIRISLLTLALAGTALFTACGPSAEEKAAQEQAMKDSIAAAEQARADSLIAAQQKAMEDSLAAVKAYEDSLAAVKAYEDSIAAAKSNKPRPKPKTVPQKINEETKKATQGRG